MTRLRPLLQATAWTACLAGLALTPSGLVLLAGTWRGRDALAAWALDSVRRPC